MVNNFLVSGQMDASLNITNICMIPKMERPTRMTELRTISLCNVGYKIISKVLCETKNLSSNSHFGNTIGLCGRMIDFRQYS